VPLEERGNTNLFAMGALECIRFGLLLRRSKGIEDIGFFYLEICYFSFFGYHVLARLGWDPFTRYFSADDPLSFKLTKSERILALNATLMRGFDALRSLCDALHGWSSVNKMLA